MNRFRQFFLSMTRLLRKGGALLNATNSQARGGVSGLTACHTGDVSVVLGRNKELALSYALGSAHAFQQTEPLAIVAAGASGLQLMDSHLSPDNSTTLFFRMTDTCATAQPGSHRFFDELDACGVTARHAVLVWGGQAIFDWQDHAVLIAQWQAWKNWAVNRHAPVLLILEDMNGAEGLLPLLRVMQEHVSNLAILDADSGGGLLTIERWTGQDTHVRRQFGVKLSDQDEFLYSDGLEIDASGRMILDAPDQGQVIATAAAVEGAKGVPAHWRVVTDLVSMELACHNIVSATILLHADGDRDFATLSQWVHRMRLSHPRALKIIIREVGNKLRYNNELVLLRLGANTVVYKEISFSRLLQIIDDMAAQTFTRPVEYEYLLALQAAEPNPVTGYLAPAIFCSEVSNMLKRTRRISLGHTLVRLPLLSRVAQLDALQACQAKRFGDIFTADQHHVYLFLFACREPDVDLTLDRLFSVPVTELFSSIIIEPTPSLIEEAVGQLQLNHEHSPLPDYSLQLSPSVSEHEVDQSIPSNGHKPVQIVSLSTPDELKSPVFKHRVVRPLPLAQRVTSLHPN